MTMCGGKDEPTSRWLPLTKQGVPGPRCRQPGFRVSVRRLRRATGSQADAPARSQLGLAKRSPASDGVRVLVRACAALQAARRTPQLGSQLGLAKRSPASNARAVSGAPPHALPRCAMGSASSACQTRRSQPVLCSHAPALPVRCVQSSGHAAHVMLKLHQGGRHLHDIFYLCG